jgi:ABC-type multidrug transport system fused ATPase/permease subunit
MFNIGIELSMPQFLGNAITELGRHTGETGFHSTGFKALSFSVALFFFLVVVRTCVGLFLGPLRNLTAQRTLGDLRAAVYDALQRQSFAWHDNARTGELISRSSTDISRLQEYIFVCLLFSVDVVAGLLGTMVFIFSISLMLGWLTLVALVPTVVAMAYFAVQLQPRWRKVHDRHGEMSTVIQENIAGVRVVKAFARESDEISKFRARKEAFLLELTSTVNYWAARVPLAQFLFGLGVPLVLWVGGRQVIRHELELGQLAKVIFYLLALGNRIGVIGQITSIIQNAGSSAQRVCEVLLAPVSLRPGNRILESSIAPASIRFDHVSFTYSSEPSLAAESLDPAPPRPTAPERSAKRHALDQLSFFIAPGETVALVGPTGGGKSTLLSLIPRFYDPTTGTVEIDGIDVRTLDFVSLRRAIGIVFQETFLFSASVADNIALGNPSANREQIEAVARMARAHGFISELAQGYDTIIGERGISLSGGQRQRIAIARALLKEPRILLLDDATSAVDPGTEREIREAMSGLLGGRTTLLVTQRVSTARLADRILFIDGGRVVEEGSHAALMARGGAYAALFQSQLEPRAIH